MEQIPYQHTNEDSYHKENDQITIKGSITQQKVIDGQNIVGQKKILTFGPNLGFIFQAKEESDYQAKNDFEHKSKQKQLNDSLENLNSERVIKDGQRSQILNEAKSMGI